MLKNKYKQYIKKKSQLRTQNTKGWRLTSKAPRGSFLVLPTPKPTTLDPRKPWRGLEYQGEAKEGREGGYEARVRPSK